MKKIVFVFALILFLSISFQVNAQWFWQNPLPQGNTLKSVQYISENTLVAIGDAGTILKSIDDGINWKLCPTGTSQDIYSVFFTDSITGWAVGGSYSTIEISGIVLKTNDSGENWDIVNDQINNQLYSVYFLNKNNGWSVGQSGLILHTNDGGLNWIQQLSNVSNPFSSVFFVDSLIGFVTGVKIILKTSDGGNTWVPKPVGTQTWLRSIHFISQEIGFCAGDDGIFRTTDSGENWIKVCPFSGFNDIIFADSVRGWAVGNEGKIVRTEDGGNSWQLQVSETYNQLYSVSFIPENRGFIVGEGGILISTSDGGNNYTTISTGYYINFNCSFFFNENRGICSGNVPRSPVEKTLVTTDGGNNWVSLFHPGNIWDFSFVDSLNGWAVGFMGTILKTQNGGFTWQELNYTSNDWIKAVHFLNIDTGYIATDQGVVSKSTDGGISWINYYTGGGYNFSDLFFINAEKGFAIDANTVLITTDAGQSWTNQSLIGDFYSIEFIDDLNGWILDYNGKMLRTIDGGTNWQNISLEKKLRAFDFVNPNVGWAIGFGSGVYKSKDGGLNWQNINVGTKYGSTINFINENIGWITGYLRTILKTTDAGITFVSIDMAHKNGVSNYSLSQNFPNPFNPSTNIQYAISSTQFVTLKVYDVLGREVATLVNEEKTAGSYKVDFQSTVGSHQLANGVYFYRLQASDFVETKKMILLK